jgi:uncharacterized protein YkwD
VKSYILIVALLSAVLPACAISDAAIPAQAQAGAESVDCPAPDVVRQRMLEAINRVRSEPRSCGAERFQAAPALTWHPLLRSAAESHSRAMAQEGFFSHIGPEGRDAGHRAQAAGYAWQRVGENLAAGQASVEAVIAGWLSSPGHCANLMDPAFTEMGAACVSGADTRYRTLWTLLLARPR